MSNYSNYEATKEIIQRISKKIPQGIMIGNTTVGHIEWQMYLMRDYLKLDGTPLANASSDYDELLKFAQDNSLITADTTDKSLFKYDSTTDVLTLPDYIGLCLQGGNTVEEKEAGLPNIKGVTGAFYGLTSGAFVEDSSRHSANVGGSGYGWGGMKIDASRSSSIYSDNVNTVQPPAITLIPQIKYKKSTSVWESVEIGQFVATAPAYYEREQLFSTNKTTITIYPTWINIDGIGYVLEGNKTIDITNSDSWDDSQYATASNRIGRDFYIYACKPVSSYEPKFVLSANSTVPTGYTATTSRKIGGFHCLCVDVGTISGHTLSGYLAGEILPNSPWDLNFRAISENEGMVWIPQAQKWIDIYLASWDGNKLVSVYSGTIADGESNPKFHGEKFVETFGLVNKELLSRDEFMIAAKGSNEGTNIYGSADPATTGGHVDTNSRRMISNYGLEDCCGVLWQWSSTLFEAQSTSYTNGNYNMNSYSYQERPVYNPDIDSQRYGFGNGLLRRAILGGDIGLSTNCGSRIVNCNVFGTIQANFSARGSSRLKVK